MDFNKLRTFIEVARSGSISAAASKLHRTQPAITQQIQALEASLELSLFERKHGRIYLTKQGQLLFEYARHRLHSIEDYLAQLKNELESLTGEIRIGIRPDVALYMLPIVFSKFKQDYPRVRFSIAHGDAAQTEALLLQNDIDIGVQLYVRDAKLLQSWPAVGRPIILAAANTYLESRGRPKKPRDLLQQDHDLIDVTEDCDGFAHWAKWFHKPSEVGFRKRRPAYLCPDQGFAAELVKKGLGISYLPTYTVAEELENGSVVEVLPQRRTAKMNFEIVVRRGADQSAAEQAFLDVMRTELCE